MQFGLRKPSRIPSYPTPEGWVRTRCEDGSCADYLSPVDEMHLADVKLEHLTAIDPHTRQRALNDLHESNAPCHHCQNTEPGICVSLLHTVVANRHGTSFSRPYDLTRHEDTIHNARKRRRFTSFHTLGTNLVYFLFAVRQLGSDSCHATELPEKSDKPMLQHDTSNNRFNPRASFAASSPA